MSQFSIRAICVNLSRFSWFLRALFRRASRNDVQRWIVAAHRTRSCWIYERETNSDRPVDVSCSGCSFTSYVPLFRWRTTRGRIRTLFRRTSPGNIRFPPEDTLRARYPYSHLFQYPLHDFRLVRWERSIIFLTIFLPNIVNMPHDLCCITLSNIWIYLVLEEQFV